MISCVNYALLHRTLCITFLVGWGSVIGRTAHFEVGATKHYLNLYFVAVGKSGHARKGTGKDVACRLLTSADPSWAGRIQSGLSSGEGLIWAVRDEIRRKMPIREKKRIVDYEWEIVDAGVDDKRLLALEPEFASLLKVMGREGNTLSPVIRAAWESGDLQSLTKNSPAKATGAHISIIAHTGKEEVLRYLDCTEAGNGFANRFLWVCVGRSKFLPDGGDLHQVDFAPFLQRLTVAAEFARGVGAVTRTAEARELWHQVYPALSAEVPGLLGAMTARAEAQTMRLACLYAVLDGSLQVDRVHLEAALEVWRYCEASARFIFGDALGDPVADEILRLLRENPMGVTRTEISSHFGRHQSAVRLSQALGLLRRERLAEKVVEPSAGRSAERWFAVQPGQSPRTSTAAAN